MAGEGEEEEAAMMDGYLVGVVGEEELEKDASRADGRLYRVEFGPDLLGMDLAYDKERAVVSRSTY